MSSHALPPFTAFIIFFIAIASHAEKQNFDTNILKRRGLDPTLGHYFSDATKFLPGEHLTLLIVNGNNKGKIPLNFDEDGNLCADDVVFDSTGLLKKANDDLIINPKKDTCTSLKKIFPSVTVITLVNKNEVDIIVPPSDLISENYAAFQKVSSGGTATLFNYALVSSHTDSGDYENNYNQADIEIGANSSDWLLRSHHLVADNNGKVSNSILNTYLQHTLVNSRTTFQAGLINTDSPIFSTGNIVGIQFTPEGTLVPSESKTQPVSGIARTNQARVEVRQKGQLIYSTLVSAGPFTLDNIPLILNNSDLVVTIKETDNRQSSYTVSQYLLNNTYASPVDRFQFATGMMDDEDSGKNQGIISLSDGFVPANWMTITSATMMAKKYAAFGGKFSLYPINKLRISETIKASNDFRNKHEGISLVSQGDFSLPEEAGLTLSATHYSNGYRELEDTFQNNFTSNSSEYSASVNWQHQILGTFTATYTLNKNENNTNNNRYVYLTWGKTFKSWGIAVNWQRQLDKHTSEPHSENYKNDERFYVSVNIPFGKQNFSSYYHNQGEESETGLQTNANLSENERYTLSAGHNNKDNENTFNGTLNANLHYSQLSLSVGKNGRANSNYGAMAGGGVTLYNKNVIFSPYPIKDTFGIVDINADTAGVEFFTSTGNIWTDKWGHAVIPYLTPYHTENIEINSDTLPAGTIVADNIPPVKVGRGAVGETMLHLKKTNNALIQTHMKNGDKLPKGATIVDGQGNYTATVVDDGLLFIEDVYKNNDLYLQDHNGDRICKITFSLAQKQKTSSDILKTNGTCK